jgi:hypothetical protein
MCDVPTKSCISLGVQVEDRVCEPSCTILGKASLLQGMQWPLNGVCHHFVVLWKR